MGTDNELQIAQILWSTNVELATFCKRIQDSEEKLTDQDIGSLVSNLERRHHALDMRLKEILKNNSDYAMPEELTGKIVEDVQFLQQDRSTKIKVELVAGHQAGFWGILKKLELTINPKDTAQPETPEQDKHAA